MKKQPSPFLKLMEEKFGELPVPHSDRQLQRQPSGSRKRKHLLTSIREVRQAKRPTSKTSKGMEKSLKRTKSLGGLCNTESEKCSSRRSLGCNSKLCWWEPNQQSFATEFFRDTSLHGLKYIGQPERHLSERIFWSIAFLSGLILSVVLINDVWRKYNDNPVIVSFQPFETSVDQIPFPAVTICNMNKILKTKAEEYIKASSGPKSNPKTRLAMEDVYYLDHVCSVSSSFTKRFNYSNGRGDIDPSILKSVNEFLNNSDLTSVKAFLQKASQNCSDMLPLCVWQDEVRNCSELFKAIETDFGKCCTFNMIPQSLLNRFRNDSRDNEDETSQWEKWNLDKDGLLLNENQSMKGFPRRQMQAGKTFGLSITLNPSLKEYYCTSSDSVGFRLQTHLSIDVPHVVDFGLGIKPNSEVFIDVRPEITMADEKIFGFSLVKRQCYYVGEFTLKYYAYYSSSNCIDECIANATYATCKCVRYYMPRDDKQQLCGPANSDCAEDVKSRIIHNGVKNACEVCRPTCTEMHYSAGMTVTPLQQDFNIWEGKASTATWSNSNISIVHIFFGIDSTYARVRKELYGSTDLFANTGGLMGLCLGFSGLSAMEVIYFLTLRAWCGSRRKLHIRAKIARKFQELWAKTKAMMRLESIKENENTNLYSQTKIIHSSIPNPPLTTVSVEETPKIENHFRPMQDINHKKLPDYKNIFGEVNLFTMSK